MKLWLLHVVFGACARLCKVTGAIDRGAQWLHLKAWNRCTAENVASCNSRNPERERFC